MDQLIEYGRAWLETLHYYHATSFTDQRTDDLAAALVQMTYKRYDAAYKSYWSEQIELEEASRRMEDEVAELLGTKVA